MCSSYLGLVSAPEMSQSLFQDRISNVVDLHSHGPKLLSRMDGEGRGALMDQHANSF